MKRNVENSSIAFPSTIELGKRYKLIIDQKESQSQVTLQYAFKPANIDPTQSSLLTIHNDTPTQEVDLQHHRKEDGKSIEFKGSLKSGAEKEFVIELDNATNCFSLKRVDKSIINLRQRKDENDTEHDIIYTKEPKGLPKFLKKEKKKPEKKPKQPTATPTTNTAEKTSEQTKQTQLTDNSSANIYIPEEVTNPTTVSTVTDPVPVQKSSFEVVEPPDF